MTGLKKNKEMKQWNKGNFSYKINIKQNKTKQKKRQNRTKKDKNTQTNVRKKKTKLNNAIQVKQNQTN